MPEVIRFAKGTASEHLNFTGENGEITLICDDTPNRKVTGVIRLHDGQTVGGIPFGGSQLLNDLHDVNAANTIEFQVMTVDANGQFYFANTVETIADGTISGDKIYGGTISTSAAVFEGSSSNAIVRITQTGTGNGLVVEDSANPDSTPFVVDASGKVGIGTSSPADPLDVRSTGTAYGTGYIVTRAMDSAGIKGVFLGYDADENGGTIGGANFLTFQTYYGGWDERMRIDSSGNVGIGTDSPTNNTILHIKDTDAQIKLESTNGLNAGFIDFDGNSLQLSTNRNMIDGVFSNTGKSNAAITLYGVSGGSQIKMYTASGDNTVGVERLNIDSSGTFTIKHSNGSSVFSFQNEVSSGAYLFRSYQEIQTFYIPDPAVNTWYSIGLPMGTYTHSGGFLILNHSRNDGDAGNQAAIFYNTGSSGLYAGATNTWSRLNGATNLEVQTTSSGINVRSTGGITNGTTNRPFHGIYLGSAR